MKKKRSDEYSLVRVSNDECMRWFRKFMPPEISSKFSLTEKQIRKARTWYRKLKPKIMKIQEKQYPKHVIDMWMKYNEPYYGVSGGGLTYSFTPTSLGTVVVIQEAITGKKIDLTNYEEW